MPAFLRDVPGREFERAAFVSATCLYIGATRLYRPPDHPTDFLLRDVFSSKGAAQVSKVSSVTSAFKMGVHQNSRYFYIFPIDFKVLLSDKKV